MINLRLDLHTTILNYVYVLYERKYSQYAHLCDLGYFGRPDPVLTTASNERLTPDFISFSDRGDVQIIDVKAFENLEIYTPSDERTGVVQDAISKTVKYLNASADSIVNWFKLFDKQVKDKKEIVVVVPEQIHAEYEPTIDETSKKLGLIIWSVDPSNSHLRIACGTHQEKDLNAKLKDGIDLYFTVPDLIFYRGTRRELVLMQFVEHLVSYLSYESKLEFVFDEIDNIMSDSHPPIFAHLCEAERTQYWRTFLLRCITNLRLIKRSNTKVNTFEFIEPTILESPYKKSKVLERVRKELRLENYVL